MSRAVKTKNKELEGQRNTNDNLNLRIKDIQLIHK